MESLFRQADVNVWAPVLRDKNTDADGLCDDERICYLGDANFHITTLVNTGGDAIERHVYTPYDVLTVYDATWANIRSTSSYANAYTYTGRQLDAETGLYYYWARMYSAQLGRFVSRDPIGYRAGMNLLEYAWDSPIRMLDPSGMQLIFVDIFSKRPPKRFPSLDEYAFSQCKGECFSLSNLGILSRQAPRSAEQRMTVGIGGGVRLRR